MIYKQVDDKFVRIDGKEVKTFKDVLEKEFPGVFPEEGNQPILIGVDSAPSFKVRQVIFAPKQKDVAISVKDAPSPSRTVPTVAKRIDPKTGMATQYYWFDRAPTKTLSRRSPNKAMRILAPTSINATNDTEKLIWLYFFSDAFTNGEKKIPNAYFEFIKVHEIASKEIHKLQVEDDAKRHVINEKTRVSYTDLRKIASVMGIPLTGVEDADRVAMYAAIKKPDTFKIFEGHVSKIVFAGKNALDLSEIAQKVTAAIKSKNIAIVENNWVLQSTKGNVIAPLAVVRGVDDTSKVAALCEELIGQPEKVEKIAEIIE